MDFNERLGHFMIIRRRRFTQGIIALLILSVIFLLGGCRRSGTPEANEDLLPTQTPITSDVGDKVLIVTGEYVPYVGQSLENHGFLTQLIKQTLDQCDFEYEIEFYPWARCSEMIESGEAWASYPFGHSENNDSEYLFSDTIYNTKHLFYYLKDNDKIKPEFQDYNSIDDFKEYVFGGANGYWYGNRNDIEALGVKAEWANNTDALLKMLNSGRIDFLVEDELVCEEAISRLFPEKSDKFVALPSEANLMDYYLIASKNYPDSDKYLDKFNQALKGISVNEETNQE